MISYSTTVALVFIFLFHLKVSSNTLFLYLFNAQCPKMVRHTLKILEQMLQDF